MNKVLWIGAPFFQSALARAGVQVFHLDFREARVWTWPELVARAGFRPDVLVVADKSRPPFLARIENVPCLTVFLCVDSHIHSWYPGYAQAFDLCTVSLRDHVSRFHTSRGARLAAERVLWLPAFAKDEDQPPEAAPEPDVDLLFVGNVDAERTPKRKRFLEVLGQRVPGLVVRQGSYRALYPQARVVLNIAENGDLNFRVFEALGLGACLLTPDLGHGLRELFTPERDMFLYRSGDVEDAAGQAERLLADPELRARAAASGKARVDQAHRASHRARDFLAFLERVPADELVRERLRQARHIHARHLRLLYLHWAEAVGIESLRRAYLRLSHYDDGLEG